MRQLPTIPGDVVQTQCGGDEQYHHQRPSLPMLLEGVYYALQDDPLGKGLVNVRRIVSLSAV